MVEMALHRPCLGNVLNVNADSRLGKAGNRKRVVHVRAVATNETRVGVLAPLKGDVTRKHSMRSMTSSRFLKLRRSHSTNATQMCRRKPLPCRASWGEEEISESEDLDAREQIQLDSSVFEEVYPSVQKVVKPVGARVRGMPIPQSTLIPDDWKDVQQYLHRGKKERKQETLALQMEWAKRRALEDRSIRQEVEDNRRREQLVSAGAAVVSGDKEMASQVEDLETGVGISSNVVSGRARPKDFRSELHLSSVEDIAQILSRYEEVGSSSRVEVEQVSNEDSEDVDAPRANEKKPLLTPEERAMLKNKKLNFAKISSNKWSPLHTLAAAGQVYLAADLLKRAVELDAVDSDGLTPLHRAVQAGQKTMARMLLKAGANAQVLDTKGATLLHYSAQNGNQDISKLLLRHGVDVNTADEDGWTPLHVAIQSGRLDLVKALVYRGADVSIANKDGRTALDLALAFGGCFNFYDAIKYLKKVLALDLRDTSASDEGDDEST